MIKIIKLLISSLAFMQIIFGCSLAGALLGIILNKLIGQERNFVPFVTITFLGFVGGLMWANKISKKQDPADYLSQIRRSDDLNGENTDFFNRS
jgi:putative Mn2+ efflux pump MntP